MNPNYWFVFDVESIGLHGEGYAVGIVVYDKYRKEIEVLRYACQPKDASGCDENRLWVAKNIPDIAVSCASPEDVRENFWLAWIRWAQKGAKMAAECAWPVEARFLCACVAQGDDREWRGPYPLLDISSVIFASGVDPMQQYPRLPDEMPVHDPVADARQSARLFFEAMDRI